MCTLVYLKIGLIKQYSSNYNRGGHHNYDIAVMIVDSFDFTQYVKPACLPSNGFEVTEGFGLISGWGNTESGGN